MPALILSYSLVPSLYFTFHSTSSSHTSSFALFHLLCPFCFLSSLAPSSVLFPSGTAGPTTRNLRCTNVSLTVSSVCLSSSPFSLPVLSLSLPHLARPLSSISRLICLSLVLLSVLQYNLVTAGGSRGHSFACYPC